MTLWMAIIVLMTGNIILVTRLHSLYGKSVIVRIVLGFTFLLENGAYIVSMSTFGAKAQIMADKTPGFTGVLGCIAVLKHDERLLSTLPPASFLALAIFYLGLASKPFLSHLNERSDLQSLQVIRQSDRLASIISLMYRDGILVYAATFCVGCFDLIMFTKDFGEPLSFSAVPWLVGVYALACPRLMLMLGGDPGGTVGIYKSGTEYLVGAYTRSESIMALSSTDQDSILDPCQAPKRNLNVWPFRSGNSKTLHPETTKMAVLKHSQAAQV